MKSFIVVCTALLISNGCFSQNCNQEELSKRPGKWKVAQLKGSLYEVTAKEVAAEKIMTNKIDEMVKTGYQPVGTVAFTNEVFGYLPAIGTNWIGNPFYYEVHFRKYLCSQGKEYVNGEARIDVFGSVFVIANSMEWIASITASGLNPDNKNGYVILKDMPVEKDGIYYFDLSKEKETGFEAVLITKDGALPYKYLTRKEFLIIRKRQLEIYRKEQMANTVKRHKIRPAAEQEAAKQKEIADLKKGNYTQPYIDRYLKDYKTDEQKKEADIIRTNKYYDTPLDLINRLLTVSTEDDLKQPAIITAQDTYESFGGFVSDKNGMCFIKPDPDYCNRKLPKTSPQFFTVFYKWLETDPVYKNAVAGVKKSINYKTLKNMLGK